MTIESHPSKNATILDLPRVKTLTAEFQYFYWTQDEFENGMGSSQASLTQIPSETFDASYVVLTRKLPRLVKLTWSTVTLNRDPSSPGNPILIRDYLDKLHSEETFTSDDFTTLQYQDTTSDIRLKFFVDQFTSLLPGANNANSADEQIALVNSSTSDQVTAQFLAEIISDLAKQGVGFSSPSQASVGLLDRLSNVVLNARLNNRVLIPITNTVKQDSVGIFSDEFSNSQFTTQLQHIQDVAISNSNANLISHLDYEFEVLSYVNYQPVDTNGYEPVVQSLGYILEKREVHSDGSVEQHPPIIIEDALTSTTFDGQVRYNSVYYYKIRPVYLVEAAAVDETSQQNLLVSFLVGSKFTKEIMVATTDLTPPPPPADFNLAWDYTSKALRCSWNLPNNPQQDIKFIQLFRRSNISEPYQLIKMWDFNDTNTKVALSEYPLPELLLTVPDFVGIYLDTDFGKDSNFIYAVAAVDAHGLCSNYSLQFQAKFNRFENKIIKKLISISGAPKQYPNAYLNADTFVDTIRDSGHTSVQVIFNPDYITLTDGNNADLGLIKTSAVNGKYRIQMINVDLQTQQNLEITLKDYRLTANKPI